VCYLWQEIYTPLLGNVTEGTILKTKSRFEDKIKIDVKEVLNDGNWNQMARNWSSGRQF
jgi:hypothetical protein